MLGQIGFNKLCNWEILMLLVTELWFSLLQCNFLNFFVLPVFFAFCSGMTYTG